MKHFSPLLIVSRLAHNATTSVIAFSGLLALVCATTGVVQTMMICISIYYLGTRLYILFYDWIAVKYNITQSGVILETGLLKKRKIVLKWNDIRSVSISSDPILRFKNLSQVELVQYSSSTNRIILFAISNVDTDIINSHIRTNTNHKIQTKKKSWSNIHDKVAITPQLRIKDYFLIGFTYAQFVVIIPTIYSFLQVTLFHQQYNDDRIQQLYSFLHLTLSNKILIIIVLVILGLIYSTFISWVRFSRIMVYKSTDGYEYSAGLIDRRTRFIPLNNIEGIIVSQNLLMRLTNRYQLKVITGGKESSERAYPIIPLGDQKTIENFLITIKYRESLQSIYKAQTHSKNLSQYVPFSIILLQFFPLLAIINHIFIIQSLIVLLVFLVLLIIITYYSTSFIISDNGETGIATKGFFNVKHHIFFTKSIHEVGCFKIGRVLLLTIRLRTNFTRLISILSITTRKSLSLSKLISVFVSIT